MQYNAIFNGSTFISLSQRMYKVTINTIQKCPIKERKSTPNHEAVATKRQTQTGVDVSKSLSWTSVHTFSAVTELQGEPGFIREEYQRQLSTLPPNMTGTPVLSGCCLSLEKRWTNCRSLWLKDVRSEPVSDRVPVVALNWSRIFLR